MESNENITSAPAYHGMLWIPGGTFRMESEDFYPEASPMGICLTRRARRQEVHLGR
jgi:formylglycine-generating enzyme required for sulfatase activity